VSIKFGTYGYDSSLPNVTGSFGTMAQGEAESAMDARASAETGDSEGNCDVWMTRNAITDSQSIVGVPAVAMCRAISLDGTPCDLPTAKVLMRIWQHRDFIDTNDPTAAANTSKKLSAWGFGSADGAGVWSSSEYGSYYAVRVTSSGSVGYDSKSNQFGVVPVLEIPCDPPCDFHKNIHTGTCSTHISTVVGEKGRRAAQWGLRQTSRPVLASSSKTSTTSLIRSAAHASLSSHTPKQERSGLRAFETALCTISYIETSARGTRLVLSKTRFHASRVAAH
jgi:hypothetical protein